MRSVDELSLEGIANTLFLHYMDIERLDKKPDLATRLERVVILYHELVSVRGLHHHLIMHALKDGGGYRTRQHRRNTTSTGICSPNPSSTHSNS